MAGDVFRLLGALGCFGLLAAAGLAVVVLSEPESPEDEWDRKRNGD